LGLTPRPDRIRRTRSRVARVFCLCSLVFLAIAFYFLMFPAKIGGVWHLINGNTASYKAWTVPVPEGFFAMQRKGILYIGRIERASVMSKGEYDLLVIVTVPSRNYFISERDSRKFQEIESALAKENGLVERSTKIIRVGENIRYCAEFGRPDTGGQDTKAPEIQISCFIEGEPTTVSYTGRRKFSSEIYSVLQGMSKTPPVKAGGAGL
jgi:hypothetical protein